MYIIFAAVRHSCRKDDLSLPVDQQCLLDNNKQDFMSLVMSQATWRGRFYIYTKATKNISFLLDSNPALKKVGNGEEHTAPSNSLNLRAGWRVDSCSTSPCCGEGNWCCCNTDRTNVNSCRKGFALSKRRVKVFPCGVLTLQVIT
mmetsp:Transcript_24416/g.41351  ORF Transcript_24416/g.41351 Transcript_24416/m.41351 type:complete len:145 (-) Transcript_24416:1268-1702(-)